MKNFLTKNKGITILIIVTVLAIVVVLGIILSQNPKKSDSTDKDTDPKFEIMDDDDSEVVSDDALEIADPEDEAQDMQEGGIDFPNDIYDDDYVPNTDSPDDTPDDTTTENPDDTTTENPDDGASEDPGLDVGTDSTPGWGWIF